MAGSHRRKFLAFTGKHCRDCRGKPRTLSHYRRLYQDCPGVHRMIEPESTLRHWVIRSVSPTPLHSAQQANGQLTIASLAPAESSMCKGQLAEEGSLFLGLSTR